MGEGISAVKRKIGFLLVGETRQGENVFCLVMLSVANIAQC